MGEVTKARRTEVMRMSKKYWCQECNRETCSEEELMSAGGSFKDGATYCPEGHNIDVYGKERLVDEFAVILSAMSLTTQPLNRLG